jgi:hypothetical protein
VKYAKIVLVAQWDGWCGACAADRPLVLTRTGRQRLRTWLTGAADDSRPLTLTCRLCGTGVDVPLERDDPPVLVTSEEPVAVRPTVVPSVPLAVAVAPTAPLPVPATVDAAALTAGRQAVAQALGGLLAQRSAAAPALPAAPVLPLQRTASPGGLAELHLLADGIDLLSTSRA